MYGNLAELKWIGPHFPLRVVRRRQPSGAKLEAFDLFGPTCDSIDSMPGPHWLPADVDDGELGRVGMMGAYSNALKTRFNGFGGAGTVVVHEPPWYLGAFNTCSGLHEAARAA